MPGSSARRTPHASHPNGEDRAQPAAAPPPASPLLSAPSRRSALLAGGIGAAALLGVGAAFAPHPARLGEPIGDRELASAVAGHLDGCRTVAIALIEGGQARMAGFGAEPDREFEIGSVSKTFTAALVMDAVARGELALDATVADVLGARATGSAVAGVTVRELASHTSGIPSLPGPVIARAWYRNPLRHDPYAGFDSEQVIDLALDVTPTGRGEVAYSNHAVALEGQLVAQAAGAPWEELLRTRLLEPLGLRATRAPITADALGDAAPTGVTEAGHRAGAWTLDGFAPAGGIRSTLADMAVYLRSMMDGTNPGVAGIEPTVAKGPTRGVGVNWFTETLDSGGRAIWHNGMTGGFHSFCGWNPDSGRGWLLLSDTAAGETDRLAFDILDGKVL